MTKTHIEKSLEGYRKIQDGISDLNAGPFAYTLEVLFAAYRTLIDKYAPFRVGQRVMLAITPNLDDKPGWRCSKHFLVRGALGMVRDIECDSHGRLLFGIEFENESWVDREGKEQPVSQKHIYLFFEEELRYV